MGSIMGPQGLGLRGRMAPPCEANLPHTHGLFRALGGTTELLVLEVQLLSV